MDSGEQSGETSGAPAGDWAGGPADGAREGARPRAGGNWFVGAWPSPQVAHEIAAWSQLTFEPGGWRCSLAGDLHATLAFLGQLEVERAGDLARVLELELRGVRKTRLECGELRGFPAQEEFKRVAYLSIVDDCAGAWWHEAVERIGRACARAGLPQPGPGIPHLTLARARSAGSALPHTSAPGWEFRVDALHLACRSEGARQGRYMSFARISCG